MKFGPYSVTRDQFKLDTDTIEVDSCLHIKGPNGSGKTTLLTTIKEDCLKRGITFSWVDQNYRSLWFWWMTPRQNIEHAWKSHSKQTNVWDNPVVKEEMQWMSELLDRLATIDVSNEDVFNALRLSGGQLQKLVLFREILSYPKVLFLDEAFSALDEKNTRSLVSWILKMQKHIGFEILSIAHSELIYEILPGSELVLSKP